MNDPRRPHESARRRLVFRDASCDFVDRTLPSTKELQNPLSSRIRHLL